MVNLLKANQTAAYVMQPAMEVFLAEKWFNLCYNNIKNKEVKTIFNSSKISNLLPLKKRLKFKLKSFV
jgi:hypothetical protein